MEISIKITNEQFDAIRHDEKFITILRLTRYINQISFCYQIYEDSLNHSGILKERQVANSLFLLSGYLYEVFRLTGFNVNKRGYVPSVYEDLKKHFSNYSSFQNYFNPLVNGNEVKSLVKNYLKKIRNTTAFHVDSEVFREPLKKGINYPEYHFFYATGDRVADYFFRLADNLATSRIVNIYDDDEKELEKFKDFAEVIYPVSLKLVKASTKIVHEFIKDMDWEVTK